MAGVALARQLDVERGPDWLFVKVRLPDDTVDPTPELAAAVWELLEQHFTNRLVLELDDLPRMTSYLIGQLLLLQKRVSREGGLLRLCGLSPECREALRLSHLDGNLPSYDNREAAVLGPFRLVPR